MSFLVVDDGFDIVDYEGIAAFPVQYSADLYYLPPCTCRGGIVQWRKKRWADWAESRRASRRPGPSTTHSPPRLRRMVLYTFLPSSATLPRRESGRDIAAFACRAKGA